MAKTDQFEMLDNDSDMDMDVLSEEDFVLSGPLKAKIKNATQPLALSTKDTLRLNNQMTEDHTINITNGSSTTNQNTSQLNDSSRSKSITNLDRDYIKLPHPKRTPKEGSQESGGIEEREVAVEEYDLVIVGAGIAALYTLWTILNKQPCYGQKKILLVEQAHIIGGRLRTDVIDDVIKKSEEIDGPDSPQINFVTCEEGGMRFCIQRPPNQGVSDTDTDRQVMPKLIDLIKNLQTYSDKLKVDKFHMVPDGPIDFRRHWYDGKSFTSWYAQQNPNVWDEIFILDDKESGRSPSDIYTEVYQRLLRENYPKLIGLVGKEKAGIVLRQDATDMAQIRLIQDTDYWYKFKKYFMWMKVPLYQYTMRSLMTVMEYTQGCIRMLEVTGFQCFTLGRGNAGTIIQMQRTHWAMTDSFYCLRNGFSALIDALQYGINAKLGRPKENLDWVWLNHKLMTIKLADDSKEVGNDSTTELTIEDITPCTNSPPHHSSKPHNPIKTIKAKDVILAIPRKPFERIDIVNISYDERRSFQDLLDTVVDVNMTKINLYFDGAWWNCDQVDSSRRLYGGSNTSLPIAQVYPFYQRKIKFKKEGCPKEQELCALTIYCDVEDSGFWSDLQDLPGRFSSDLQSKYPQLVPASVEVVKEALRELSLLFNVRHIPSPLLTTYTRWAGDADNTNPVAIHQWRRDVDDRIVRWDIARPFGERRVYLCNEAWSEFQGWIEGSLMAAEEVVNRFCQPPDN